MKRYTQKIQGTVLLFAVLFMQGVFLFSPQPARAQVITASPDLTALDFQQQISEKVASGIENALVASLASQLMNMLLFAVNQMAYQTVVWVTSGGPGETPLFTNQQMSDYGRMVGASVAVEIIDTLDYNKLRNSGELEELGLPRDPGYLSAIRQGLVRTYTGEPLQFDFSNVHQNYAGFLASLAMGDYTAQQKSAQILAGLSSSFTQNELTSGLDLYGGALEKAMEAEADAKAEHLENDGYLDQKDAITGLVTLNANQVQKQVEDALETAQQMPFDLAQRTLSDKDVLTQVGGFAGAAVSSALISQLTQKMYSGLYAGLGTSLNPFYDTGDSAWTREKAQQEFKSILAFSPITVTDYSLVTQLSSCPNSIMTNTRDIYSCAIDTSFASAVNRSTAATALTLENAIKEGYIDGGWALVPPSDIARNQDTKCYSYAFCYSNLVKLRKARIIPVGWEIAASSPANTTSSPVTLGEAMNAFYDCNENGQLDEEHPWCHLVDPNWVLKAPDTQCRTLGYGQILESSISSARSEECVDIQTCISEDENGQCDGGYGYCVTEENTWNFQGESCPSQFASCLAFTDSEGDEVSYLVNTTETATCDEESDGCQWYAREQRVNEEGAFDWPQISDIAAQENSTDVYTERLYVNNTVESCSESEAGCTQLVERNTDLYFNNIQNGSFENDEDGNSYPDAWFANDWDRTIISNENTRQGNVAVVPSEAGYTQYGIRLSQGQTYTLSYYAMTTNASGAASSADLILAHEEGAVVQDVDMTGLSIQGSCSYENTDIYPGAETVRLVQNIQGGDYQKVSCTFTSPRFTKSGVDVVGRLILRGEGIFIDGVSLTQTTTDVLYTEGYSAPSLSLAYYKVAPSYLGCTGTDTDPAECANYAQMCSANDVGCESYTPLTGDATVTATIGKNDYCPAVCNGYDSYKQEPTLYEPTGVFPINFIPDLADSCSESAVGCDEFTNVTTGEVEYFTYLRSCVLEDQAAANTRNDNEAVFYTWEGSDESGYQLRTWNLLESDLGAVYNNADTAGGFTEAVPGDAPCTNWQATEDGIACFDDPVEITNPTCNQHIDIFYNPDCREFYDAAGEIHYREWSKTVTVSESCSVYRKTDVAGNTTVEKNTNCETSGGFVDEATNVCRYQGLAEESDLCSASENGCRSYTGGRSNNSRVAFEDAFEEGTLGSWQTVSAADVTYSNESLSATGHALRSEGATVWTYTYNNGSICESTEGCASAATSSILGGNCTVRGGEQFCGTLEYQIENGNTLTLSFWAKGEGRLRVGLDQVLTGDIPEIDHPFGDVTLTSEWRQYTVGPIDIQQQNGDLFFNGASLVFAPQPGNTFFLDTVNLRTGQDHITVIKDSWITPISCDLNTQNQYAPGYALGCQAYTTSDRSTVYLKSFSQLCSEEAIGCEGFFTTQQNTETYGQIYGGICENIDGGVVAGNTDCYLKTTQYAGVGVGTTTTIYDTHSPKLCTILKGEESCSFDVNLSLTEQDLQQTSFSHIQFTGATEVIPADGEVFLITDDEYACDQQAVGCTEVGKPVLSADMSRVESWATEYFLLDPDNYDENLCQEDQLFCAAYDAGTKGIYYFKDPQNHVCEYKTDVTINGKAYDGWFVEGTSQFCYGTGSCQNTGASCETDADCRENTGTCETTGASCSNDTDCRDGDSCTGIEEDFCKITSGDYVVGGDLSGIWRNGDAQYDGWVGSCSIDYDGCNEFIDQLDIPEGTFYEEVVGESYTFIDNDQINQENYVSGDQCKGLVSQSKGCSLFYDTSDAALTSNASASYIASAHADELFGDQPFDPVRPVDCTNGQTAMITMNNGQSVDLCAQRCVYDRGLLEDITGARTDAIDQMRIARIDFLDPLTSEELYRFGGSCYTSNDCTYYESERGDLVEGTCQTEVLVGYAEDYELVPRFQNDSNRVISVERDRTCAEWLTCQSSRIIWDEVSSSFRTVCDSVALCSEYGGDGDASFCSEWEVDDAAVLFDGERYSSRDISWYGSDYSGYTIPDQFGVQHLSQVNIAPAGYCDNARIGKTVICAEDADCNQGIVKSGKCIVNTEKDFRLAYDAGMCEESYGSACTVGYCENSGSACSSDNQCLGSTCVTGTCYAVSQDFCSTSSDCQEGYSCLSGTCMADTGSCGLDYSCEDDNAICYPSEATKEGSCFNGSCLLSMDGGRLLQGEGEEMICRAYPESTAPFTTDIVESWTAFDISRNDLMTPMEDIEQVPVSGFAYSTKSGFQSANTCLPGEDCECAYKKISSSAGMTLYVDIDTDLEDVKKELAAFFDLQSSTSSRLGICSGGDANEALCLIDGNGASYGCGSSNGTSGTCFAVTKEDSAVGLEGYCLERDTGININGDRSTGACLTWYPVDQLSGATDLYGKDVEAGYFADTYMCTYVSAYANVKTMPKVIKSSNGELQSACAEVAGAGLSCHEGEFSSSVQNVYCPEGYYALMGECSVSGNAQSNSLADICEQSAASSDYPYVCVPENGYTLVDGKEMSCDPMNEDFIESSNGSWSAAEGNMRDGGTSGYGTQVYFWNNGNIDKNDYSGNTWTQFTNLVKERFSDCTERGIEVGGPSTNSLSYTEPTQEEIDGYNQCVSDCLSLGAGSSCNNSQLCICDFPNAAHAQGTDPCGADIGDDIFRIDTEPGGSNGWRGLSNNVEIYPACKEVTAVSTQDQGYAWTDRVLGPSNEYQINDGTSAKVGYQRGTTPTPFGAVNLDIEQTGANLAPAGVASCTTSNNTDFAGSTRMGMPTGESAYTSCPTDYANPFTESSNVGTDPSDPAARSWIEFFMNVYRLGGDGQLEPNVEFQIEETNAGEKIAERITQVFAKIDPFGRDAKAGDFGTIARWIGDFQNDDGEPVNRKYDLTTEGLDLPGAEYDIRSEGNPPVVYAIDTYNCSNGLCEEGEEDAFTLNGVTQGALTGAGGFFRAKISFFAAADKNQLPLRRVVVDWGDGSEIEVTGTNDYYKNRRGLVEGSSTQTYCDTDTEWGMTSESCEPYPFEYQNNYFCSEALVTQSDWPLCESDGNGGYKETPCVNVVNKDVPEGEPTLEEVLEEDDEGWNNVNDLDERGFACVYQPRIHVRDNWGWCTGECTGDGEEGCFENGEDTLQNPGASLPSSECAYIKYSDDTRDNNPWINFEGYIQVTP